MQKIPILYTIKTQVTTSAVLSTLATNLPHSIGHGLVEGELIARVSHDHPLYQYDNAQVYYKLELALQGTSYLASIKPFKQAKNGKDTFFSTRNQYVREDKW